MKKRYTVPMAKVINLNLSEIICTSASFGEGETNTMHANQREEIFGEGGHLWDE